MPGDQWPRWLLCHFGDHQGVAGQHLVADLGHLPGPPRFHASGAGQAEATGQFIHAASLTMIMVPLSRRRAPPGTGASTQLRRGSAPPISSAALADT